MSNNEESSTLEAATADRLVAGHILVVEMDEDEDDGTVTGSVICNGITEACVTWWECNKDHDWNRDEFPRFEDAVDEGEDLHHGEEHRVIDGLVMTRGKECLAHALDSGWESAREAARGLKPGRYPCEVVYESDEYVHIAVVPAAVAASGVDGLDVLPGLVQNRTNQ